MSRPARVLTLGWFGEGNLGDEAMLSGLLNLLRRSLGPIDATVLSATPAATEAAHGTRAIRRASPADSGFRNRRLLGAVLRSDLVTLGGGDLIREQADGVVPALNWLARTRVALRLRRPTALIGVSVGELYTPSVVAEVGRDLRRFSMVAARDAQSAARLAELGARDVWTIGDLALESLGPAPPRVDGRRQPAIGVVFREILGRGPSVPESANRDLRRELAAALDDLADDLGARIELIPFRTRGPKVRPDDDARAGDELAASARTGDRWVRHPRPDTAAAFGAIAGSLDLVIAVRLHGVVLAAAAGRPVIGISYDPKVSGFLADLGLPEQVLPLGASAREIVELTRRTLHDGTAVERVVRGAAAARRRTATIEPILARLAGRPIRATGSGSAE